MLCIGVHIYVHTHTHTHTHCYIKTFVMHENILLTLRYKDSFYYRVVMKDEVM